MGDPNEFEIRFEQVSLRDAGREAANLHRELKQALPDVNVTVRKDDPDNQDLGATLVLLLGTPAVIALAKGIASYLARHRGTISIHRDGSLIATGISGDDAARIAEVFSQGN